MGGRGTHHHLPDARVLRRVFDEALHALFELGADRLVCDTIVQPFGHDRVQGCLHLSALILHCASPPSVSPPFGILFPVLSSVSPDTSAGSAPATGSRTVLSEFLWTFPIIGIALNTVRAGAMKSLSKSI